MSAALQKIGSELSGAGIEFNYVDNKIHIPLPNDFDTLVVEIWKDEDDSISLLEGVFHTHGEIHAREFGLASREKAIRHLVESIFNGSFKMVKLKKEDGTIEKKIWDTFSLSNLDENNLDYVFCN